MASAEEFPGELCTTPMPFVVLTGLDITYNAVHRSIWDAFSNNRRHDRLNMSFACLEGDHQYPQSKAKRMSYDWYIPKGLLKTGWMNKHLTQIPSVVVVFFELDWDDLAWRERHLACASRVQVVRSSLQGRTTKVAVVLIQKSSPLPPGEDMIAAERAAALCSACELSAKSLFVLPHTDHLIGYIIRLENAFYELALTYYHTECRRVKSHKEFLNKTTHQLLFPRHQFKIAFFSEIMQDPATALKHYQQSYNHIHELRLHDSNNLELKVVGGYVNYRICKLCFLRLNAPVDAINQFQRHVDLFKTLCGNKELLFEHSAWLSKQFSMFGDLFNDAITVVGLTAVQTQHPGFYYQQAAYYAQVRKQLSLTICTAVESQTYPSDDPLHYDKLEYYGQRPWRQGHQRIDLSDTSREKEGVLALKLKELEVDHSRLIVPLLSSAVSQCKKFHCPRLKRYLTIELGKEYYFAEQFDKAKMLLKRATGEYREGCWSSILTQLLVVLLDCAYMTEDILGYFSSASELLGRFSQLPLHHKSVIQDNVCDIICGKSPKHVFGNQIFPQTFVGCKVSATDQVLAKWKAALSDSTAPCVVDIDNLKSFIECKVVFAKPEFTVETCLKLFVCICVTCPKSMQFAQLKLSFSDLSYDKFCVISGKPVDDFETETLNFQPWKVAIYEFEFPVNDLDASKSLSVQSVSFKQVGSEASKGLVLIFQQKISTELLPKNKTWTKAALLKEQWSNIPDRPSVHVIERESKLDVEFIHKAPALVGEVFPIRLHISCKEKHPTIAENVFILVSIKPESDDILFQNAALSSSSEQFNSSAKTAELSCGNLKLGDEIDVVTYVKATHAGTLALGFRVSYQVRNIPILRSDGMQQKSVICCSSASNDLSINIQPPFKFSSQVTSMGFELNSSINVNEPFLAQTTVTSKSCWPIEIISGTPTLVNKDFELIGKSANVNVVLAEDESAMDCMNVVCKSSSLPSSPVQIGSYILKWKRKDDDFKALVVSSTLALPKVEIKFPSVRIKASMPAFGTLRKPVLVKYFIENQSTESKQVEVTYGSADAFIYAGPKQTNNFLAPMSTFTASFSVIPLALGFQALPQLKIQLCKPTEETEGQSQQKLEVLDTSSLPSHLTVKPSDYGFAHS